MQKKSDNEQQCFLLGSFLTEVCGVIGAGISIVSLLFAYVDVVEITADTESNFVIWGVFITWDEFESDTLNDILNL